LTAEALFESLLPRLAAARPNVSFLSALNGAIGVICDHLWSSRSDLLKTDYSVSVSAGLGAFNYGDALSGGGTFLGMDDEEFPAIFEENGNFIRHLTPLPMGERYSLKTPGVPLRYVLRGLTMSLFPINTNAVIVKGECYARPAGITQMSCELPFYGMFDTSILPDATLAIARAGMAAVVDQAFKRMVGVQVDAVVPRRAKKNVGWFFPGVV